MKSCITLFFLFNCFGIHAQVFENINVLDAQILIQENIDNENFIILDVRTKSEYDRDHLINAYTRNFYDDDFTLQMDSLNKDFTYLIYCQSGNRSGQSFTIMQDLNFKSVYNMLGGISMWKSNNLPVTTETPTPKDLYKVESSNTVQQLSLNFGGIDPSLLSSIQINVNSADNVNISELGDFDFQIESDGSKEATISVCFESTIAANSNLSAADIVRAQNIAVGLISEPCQTDILAADVNESGNVSGADLVEMVNVLIGRSSSFSKSSNVIFLINEEKKNCIDLSLSSINDEPFLIQAIKKGDLTCQN